MCLIAPKLGQEGEGHESGPCQNLALPYPTNGIKSPSRDQPLTSWQISKQLLPENLHDPERTEISDPVRFISMSLICVSGSNWNSMNAPHTTKCQFLNSDVEGSTAHSTLHFEQLDNHNRTTHPPSHHTLFFLFTEIHNQEGMFANTESHVLTCREALQDRSEDTVSFQSPSTVVFQSVFGKPVWGLQ